VRRCLKIKVLGKVQGVNYRSFIHNHATTLGIEGTIQNAEDKSVILCVCGTADKLDDLIDFLYKGSDHSKVEDVVVEPLMQEKQFRGVFRVIGLN